MNAATYRLAGEVARHLIAIGKELQRWRDDQQGVISHQHEDEPADSQPPRPPSAHGGQRRERNGSSFR
jgi:hypothetical protein